MKDYMLRSCIVILFLAILLFESFAHAQCGSERTEVKDDLDGFTPSNNTPVVLTIAEASAIQRPSGKWLSLPRQSSEMNLTSISGNLVGAGLESDNDYHLILQQGEQTIICEIPSEKCAPKSPYASTWKAERALIDSLVGFPVAGAVKMLKHPIPVTMIGLPFFDKDKHNGKGHAPNEFELHPLLQVVSIVPK